MSTTQPPNDPRFGPAGPQWQPGQPWQQPGQPQQPGVPWGANQLPYGQPPYGQLPYGQPPYGQPPNGKAPSVPPVPGQVRPRSQGLRAAVLVAGVVVALTAVTAGAVDAIDRSHVYPLSQVGGAEPATSVTAIEVKAGVNDVVITTHERSMIEWQTGWYGDPADAGSVLQRDGGTLTFTAEDEHGWRWGDWGSWFDQQDDRRTLVIRLPEDLVPDLVVDAGAGTVTIDGAFATTEVSSGIGDVDITGTAASLRVEAGVGRVTATVATPGQVVINGGVGFASVDLGTRTAPESIAIEGGVGTITVAVPTVSQGYDVSLESGVGTVQDRTPGADPAAVRVAGPIPLFISAGVGTVTVEASQSRH